jgi:hypothetical protein
VKNLGAFFASQKTLAFRSNLFCGRAAKKDFRRDPGRVGERSNFAKQNREQPLARPRAFCSHKGGGAGPEKSLRDFGVLLYRNGSSPYGLVLAPGTCLTSGKPGPVRSYYPLSTS